MVSSAIESCHQVLMADSKNSDNRLYLEDSLFDNLTNISRGGNPHLVLDFLFGKLWFLG